MKTFLIALTFVNAALVGFNVLLPATTVHADEELKVLRGKGLQIVDEQGRTRASITIHPSEVFAKTGERYPETVVLRLIDEFGRPEIKIAATKEGGGFTVIGQRDTVQAMLHAKGDKSYIKLQDESGKPKWITP